MKLEFESNTTSFVELDFTNDVRDEKKSIEASKLLGAGIKAAQEGRRAEARNLLLQVTELDSENENAWLWLASISEYPEELLVFLNSVLKINPDNDRAIEWAKATRTLLSKTFVQRGVDATKEAHKDFAKQCFLQALVHDNQNEMAWLWLASISVSDEEKTSHLQKVLGINPENQMAQASLKTIRRQMAETILQKASAAAADGENESALELLEEALANAPELEDAWLLKSFLVQPLGEKLSCFEKVLETSPSHHLAGTGAAFLRAMLKKVDAPQAFEQTPAEKELLTKEEFFEAASPALEMEDEDRSPTEELEFPEAAKEAFADEARADFAEVEEQMDAVEMEEIEYFEKPEFDRAVVFSAENEFRSDEFQEAAALETEEVYGRFEPARDAAVMENEAQDFAPIEEEVFEEDIHETETADYYIEEPADEVFAAGTDEDVYEIEVDGLFPAADEDVVTLEKADAELVYDDFETVEYYTEENAHEDAQASSLVCSFCEDENEAQAFVCRSCHAVLTLSDLEMLLASQDAHQDVVGDAVHRLEKSKTRRDLDSEELKTIAIGYFNLKNPKKGVLYLNEAARLVPDDILLSSQVNALKIRLSEIEKQESVHNSMPKNRQILVVDDSPTVRKLISGKLEKCGHEVICAVDGVDALEKLKEISPDLILLDINMPRMDGYQVCKLIRGSEEMKDTPVVMISGKDGFFDKVRGRMAGTTGYITKPFGPETLMKTVETYIVHSA